MFPPTAVVGVGPGPELAPQAPAASRGPLGCQPSVDHQEVGLLPVIPRRPVRRPLHRPGRDGLGCSFQGSPARSVQEPCRQSSSRRRTSRGLLRSKQKGQHPTAPLRSGVGLPRGQSAPLPGTYLPPRLPDGTLQSVARMGDTQGPIQAIVPAYPTAGNLLRLEFAPRLVFLIAAIQLVLSLAQKLPLVKGNTS